MKKFIIAFLSVLIMVPAIHAKEITFVLEWNPNTEKDMAGYTLYLRQDGQSYDYDNPNTTVPCQIQSNGDCIPTTGQIKFDSPDDALTVWYVVARAFDNGDPIKYSGDSNEVSQAVDLRPLVIPTDLAGVYNETTETVDLSWTQGSADRVTKWVVEYGSNDGGPYESKYEVQNTGQGSYTASIPIVAPDGVVTTKYFIVSAYAAYDIVSGPTAQVMIVIDKNVAPGAPIQLKFKVTGG